MEVENQIRHFGRVIHQVILENLLILSDEDLKVQTREMGQLVIDLTLCDDQSVRYKNHELLQRMFNQLQGH